MLEPAFISDGVDIPFSEAPSDWLRSVPFIRFSSLSEFPKYTGWFHAAYAARVLSERGE